ncbi:hypothetical protein DFH29DRAFT_1003243 [Suillus ampliporus]|nr:hypothetical protein DFH29DRAFT_1003243 [Suillus ampliporus]
MGCRTLRVSLSIVDDYMPLDNDDDPESMVDDYDSPLTDLEESTCSSEYSSLSEMSSEDSGSEYGGETYKEQPAKKRARATTVTDAGKAPAAKGSSRRKKTLSLIITMPIDMLLEIFSLLDPADLLHLSRTNKAFRNVLLSNNAISVWKAARVNRGGVPDYMPGMSEAKWANLLFGGSQCCVCGTKGVQRIDFGIRRRACTSCLKKNLTFEGNFKGKFPDFDPIIMDLIPFTNIGGWAHGHASGSKFFWSADVLKTAEQLGMYQKDVHMFKPRAKQVLEDFKQSRKEYVDSVVHHAKVCYKWVNEDRERYILCASELRSQNKELIKVRLVHLGHDAKDVKRMLDRHDYRGVDKELTDARWKRLLPRIECKLSELKEEWRLEDQSHASYLRKAHLLDMYNTYLCDVAEYINSPPTGKRESDIEACGAFADRIPEFCAGYLHQTKVALTQLLAPTTDVLQDPLTLQSQGTDAHDNALQLATSVFQCLHSRFFPLITWDKVQQRKCFCHSQGMRQYYFGSTSSSACTFSISQPGVTAACSLLSLVGLDAKITTATTMDQQQRRFFCSNCPPKPEKGGSYRMAMDWRQSVFHYVEQQDPSHAEPRWELLSAAQLEFISANERVWYCNKCDKHRGNPATKIVVMDHVRWHGITAPNEGVDFSCDQSKGLVERPPPGTKFFVTPQKPTGSGKTQQSQPPNKSNGNYRCQHCNVKGLQRTFILDGVKQHIKAKHKIDSPSEDLDFCKVK